MICKQFLKLKYRRKNKKMKILTMMIGLPRSGKTTWIRNNKSENTDTVILSADDLRYLVYNQRFWQDGS